MRNPFGRFRRRNMVDIVRKFEILILAVGKDSVEPLYKKASLGT